MRLSKLLVFMSVIALVAGCTLPMPKPSGDPGNPIRRLAILPLVNNTNDVDAPEFVRERLVELQRKIAEKYDVVMDPR